jgi:hypothetical protein
MIVSFSFLLSCFQKIRATVNPGSFSSPLLYLALLKCHLVSNHVSILVCRGTEVAAAISTDLVDLAAIQGLGGTAGRSVEGDGLRAAVNEGQ